MMALRAGQGLPTSRPVQAITLPRGAAWTVAGEAVHAVCQWGLLIAIAKLGSLEMVGQFALGLAISGPIITLANLALRPIQATDARSEFEFGEYLALRLLTTVLALLLITVVSFGAGFRLDTALIILGIGLARSFEAMSDIYYGLFQKHERMNLIAISVIMKEPLALVALAIVLSVTGSVLWGVVGWAGAWLVVLVGYDIPNGARLAAWSDRSTGGGPSWNVDRLASLGRLAWPLGLTTMLLVLNANTPRYFVEHHLGERELGIFAAMTYVIAAGGAFVNAMGQPLSPRLAKYWANKALGDFRSLLIRLVGVASLIGLTGILIALAFGPQVLTILYGAEYASRADVFVWLMVAAAIAYLASAFGYGMTAARLIRIQAAQFACAAAVGAVACAILVPAYGLKGAAWGAAASVLTQLMIAAGSLPYSFARRRKGSAVRTPHAAVCEAVRLGEAEV